MTYPKTMRHPASAKAVIRKVVSKDAAGKNVTDYHSDAARWPDVTVNNEDQEADHRSKGYLEISESASTYSYADYPVWMKAPEGQEDAMAKTDAEEKSLIERGFKRAGAGDAEAVQRAHAAPYDPAFVSHEWPKMVDGKLIEDPSQMDDHQFYPMWVGGSMVNSEAEERAARDGKILRAGQLIDEAGPKIGEKPLETDPRRAALLTLAGLKGIEVADAMTADDIEAALFKPIPVVPVEIEKPAEEKAEEIADADAMDRKSIMVELEKRGVEFDKHTPTKHLQALLSEKAA